MRLVGLTLAAMLAFAGNSVLTRMAVGRGLIDPLAFAAVRVVAGAVVLGLLVGLRGFVREGRVWPGWAGRSFGVGGLVLYLVGFSLAYAGLGAGIGALILFGVVQVTMFAGAVLGGEVVPGRRWAGAAVAFGGLVVLLAPAGEVPSLWHVGLMAVAGLGWGVYSLAGRREADALGATAANFVLAAPLVVGVALVMPGGWTGSGVVLAVVSGAVTSGLGYALWYAVLPGLGASRAALAQLTVPVIAAAGGVALGEAVSWRFAFAAALVLGGVAVGSGQSGLTKR